MLSKEMVGASTVPIILTILSSGEDYGYEIIRKVKEYSGGSFAWSEPMLYPVLHRLERNGYIGSRWHVLENGRKRKYYAITEQGRAVLKEKKDEWLKVMEVLTHMWNLQPSSS